MNIVTHSTDLTALCERLASADFVTVDTEFLRETTFWPKLCLLQIASPDEVAIVDPLVEPTLDLAPLFELMRDERVVKVFHAARQDIEIFWNLSGEVPTPLFDTQVAAMVCGYGESIAYDQLVARVTGAHIDKSSRFTNWAHRPLTQAQLDYAADDVIHLRDVYQSLRTALDRQGRSEWVAEEMAVLTSPETYTNRPEDAWKRLKMRVKSPLEFAILQAVAALREEEAQQRDVPRGRVIKDDALYEIASQKPTTPEGMAKLRVVPKGFDRSRFGKMLMDTVAAVLTRPASELPSLPKRRNPPEGSTAAAELLKVLLKQVAEEHRVAPRVLATVEELEAIAADDEADVAALHGWRREVFGEPALRLKRGEIGLTFDGKRIRTVPFEEPVRAPASRRKRRRATARDGQAEDQSTTTVLE